MEKLSKDDINKYVTQLQEEGKISSSVYPEIDVVATPDGSPTAMVHCNNCCSELDAWVKVFGEFAAWVCAKIAGARFVLFGVTQGIMFDNAAMIVLTVLLALGTLLVYWKTGRKHRSEVLLGALLLDFVLSAALLFALGENLMFLIPLGCAVAALLLGRLTGWKFWIPVAMAVILLHAFSFLHALAMALTIGAYGAVAMIAFIDLVLLIPLADEYLS